MNIFFSLPTDICQLVLFTWVNDIKSISALDAACSRADRDDFHVMIAHPIFILPTDDCTKNISRANCAEYIGWVSSRGLNVKTLHVHAGEMKHIAAIDSLSLPAVEKMVFQPSNMHPIDADDSCYLFDSCPSLTHIDCMNGWIDMNDDEAAALVKASIPLRYLSLKTYSIAHSETILGIVEHYRNTLREFYIPSTDLSNESLQFISSTCPLLEGIAFDARLPSVSNILQFCEVLSKTMRRLTLETIGQDEEPADHDAFVHEVAQRLPNAEAIIMPDMKEATWLSLQCVFNHCPKIEEVSMLNRIKVTRPADPNDVATCEVLLYRARAAEFMPFLASFPYHIISFILRGCYDFTRENVEPFVVRHGARMECLQLNLINISDVDVQEQVAVMLLICCSINLDGLRISNWTMLNVATVALFHRPSKLTFLIIHQCPHLTDDAIAALLSKCPLLRVLQIFTCELVTGFAINAALTHCPKLERALFMNNVLTTACVEQALSYARDTHLSLKGLTIPKSLEEGVLLALTSMSNACQEYWKPKLGFLQDDHPCFSH